MARRETAARRYAEAAFGLGEVVVGGQVEPAGLDSGRYQVGA